MVDHIVPSIFASEKMNVYCIIVTYNAEKWIENCITSIYSSTIKVNVTVVDNNSSDGTISIIQTLFPDVYIIKNAQNRGFGQANNQGIEFAYRKGASHFFLLNQDAWVMPSTIAELIRIQEKYKIDILSPIHFNGDGNKFDSGFFDASIIECNNNQFVSDLFLNRQNDYYPVNVVNAAAWMINKEVIENIGGFDPLFFHYGEDYNYCQRLKYHNRIIAITPKSVIFHGRKEYGNAKVYREVETMMFLLLAMANINKKRILFSKETLSMVISCFKKIGRSIISFKFCNVYIIISDMSRVFVSYGRILRSRKANMRLGKNWLSLNNE